MRWSPFEANGTANSNGDEVLFYDHLCRASLPLEHTGAAVNRTKSPTSGRGSPSGSGPWQLSRLCTPKR